MTHVNNGPKLLGDTQLGSATPSRLLTRPGYHLFSSMGHALAGTSILTKISENDLMSDFASKDEEFFWLNTNCPKDGKNV